MGRAEREHVRVVVLACVARKGLGVAGGCENARNLVCGHRRADAGSVHHDPKVGCACRYEPCHGLREGRVVDRVLAVSTAILDSVSEASKIFDEMLFELVAAVIGAERHLEMLRHW
jgi:hypothetical protein